MRWHDVDGSKIRARHLLGSLRDASRIYAHHIAVRRWERGLRGTSEQVARATKDTLARITSERRHVGPIERTARASLLVPVFGFLVVWTRVRSWLIGPVQVSAETTHGAQFRCRLPDLIQTYLYLFGTWEPDQSCFARSRLRPGDTFVDVGANIGYYSILLQDVVGPDGAVVAFEASSTTMAHLETALAVNGARPWVRAVHTAVSDRHGEIVLYGGPVNNTGLSTSLATRGFAPEGKVRCAPLPDLLDPDEIATLRLLKIDVEGAEVAVLRGLEPLLKTAPDDIEILVELSPKWWDDPDLTPEHVLAPLIEAGFNVYSIDNDLWPWRYLWPNDLRPPRRVRTKLCRRPKRLDLVLSRVDAEELSMSASS